jgi:hypothetical protein
LLATTVTACAVDAGELATTEQAVVQTPEVLATGQDLPLSVVVGATKVYWVNAPNFGEDPASILSTPKAGGAGGIVVESDIPNMGTLRLDSERLYWPMGAVEPGVGGVQSRRKGHGPVTDLVQNRRVFHIALAGDYIYLATPDDGGQIQRIAKTGGALTTLAKDVGPGLDNIPFIAVSGDRVVFSQSTFDDECDGRVRSVPVTGGPITTLDSGICNLFALVADGRSVYWAEYDSEINTGRVMRVKLDAGGGPTVLDTVAAQPMFLARDGHHVYYTTWDGANGEVRRVAKRSGASEALATEQLLPFSIDVDPTHVYWTTLFDGEVKRVAKQ